MSRQPDYRREPAIVSSLESTMPPTSPEELLASRGSSVLVFSHDAALASVIKRAADGRYPLRVINEWQDLVRLIKTDVGRIVVLDVDALTRPVEKALDELNHSTDWLVIVIAAKQQEAQDFMRFWSERRIHRLLIKPAALGITRLLLESAIARHMELHDLHEETDSLEIPPGLRDYDRQRGRKRWRMPAFAIVVLGLITAGLYWLGYLPLGETEDVRAERRNLDGPAVPTLPAEDVSPAEDDPVLEVAPSQPIDLVATAPPDATQAAARPPQVPVDPYADQLAAAAVAEQAEQFVTPRGDNALDYYVAILASDPAHVEARARLDRLLERLYMRAEAQFLDGDLAAAERTLAHIGRADADSSRLRFLSEQLTQARANASALAAAEAAAETAEAAAAAARAPQQDPELVAPSPGVESIPAPSNPELASMLTLVRRRMEQQQLVVPAGDSAHDYLERALKIDANDNEVAAAVADIVPLLIAAAQPALAEGDVDRAQALVAAATEFGAPTRDVATLDESIATARAEQRDREVADSMARATQAIAQGRLIGDGESAVALLATLRGLDAPAPELAALESELSAALIAAAHRAIAAGSFKSAETLIGALGDAGLDSQSADTLRRELDFERRQAAYLAQPAPISELELVRTVQPDYPREALARDMNGWVELLFTVDTEGATRDLAVTDADPPDVFDDAALAAVGRYRFAPFELDGSVYERRVRVRLRFVLE